jgi:protein PhnA
MALIKALQDRSNGCCELCNSDKDVNEITVAPRSDEPENQVVLCVDCRNALATGDAGQLRIAAESVWSELPAVQVLSFRILQRFADQAWAADALGTVYLDDQLMLWVEAELGAGDKHRDCDGQELVTGDNIIVIQDLVVKGANFTAKRGTVVKRIRIVSDEPTQIEGKVNDQTIILLTKFVRKV